MTSRQQPPWAAPTPPPDVRIPPLRIHNSLTRSKNAFVPLDPNGRTVNWYACGPTVYDDAHLGHARNYVSTDIIRRIMRDHFRFNVRFVMNITDVDDKIIVRARQQHLLARFKHDHPSLDEDVRSTVKAAFDAYVKKNLPRLPADLSPEQYEPETKKAYGGVLAGASLAGDGSPAGDQEAKIKMHLKTASAAARGLSTPDPSETYAQAEDVLLPYLDSLHGSSIDSEDHSIFTTLTKRYEQRFTEDMRALNVLDADIVTRVTEYGPQIVAFVEAVERNGFAYATTDGSVYFDIAAFERAGYPYARLEPWNRNDTALQADGEGALAKRSTEKRSDADFALWKGSKPGEPSWASKWGPGRPGWHVECSAMASDVLGQTVDIHSGGIDLAFPHHDNELAQSEAYWCTGRDAPWVRYFLHMGHLSISGAKMSKSLKNFTTIREALASRGGGSADWTPRGLRIVFLLGGWKDGVEITDDLVKAGASWEDRVDNFFIRARDLEQHPTGRDGADGSEVDKMLAAALDTARVELDAALCDSFDTPAAMRVVSALIGEYNATDKAALLDATVLDLARWVTTIVTMFGLDAEARPPASTESIPPPHAAETDLPASSRPAPPTTHVGWSGIDVPDAAKPYVYPLSALRDVVRHAAIAGITPTTHSELAAHAMDPAFSLPSAAPDAAAQPYAAALTNFRSAVSHLAAEAAPAPALLAACDAVRNDTLWSLGIYLEDAAEAGAPALVRRVNRGLAEERAARDERERAKAEAKAQRLREDAEKAALKREQGRVPPQEMFRTDEWSAWDEEGVPTRDREGNEVAKSRAKKMRKEWERQRKLHEEFLAGEQGGLA